MEKDHLMDFVKSSCLFLVSVEPQPSLPVEKAYSNNQHVWIFPAMYIFCLYLFLWCLSWTWNMSILCTWRMDTYRLKSVNAVCTVGDSEVSLQQVLSAQVWCGLLLEMGQVTTRIDLLGYFVALLLYCAKSQWTKMMSNHALFLLTQP